MNAAARSILAAEKELDAEKRDYLAEEWKTNVSALADSFAASEQHFDRVAGVWKAPLPPRLAPVKPPIFGTSDAFVTDSGALQRLADTDETTQLASIMQTQSGKFHARVESVLQQICRDETGQFETEEKTKKRIEKDARLKEQGNIICDALESQGVKAWRSDEWKLCAFGVHSHEVFEIPAYRRICLNPYVAARLRAPFLNWLQYFAQGKESALRFWTFTTGQRCLIHRLGARIKWMHRRLSELNAAPFMVNLGVRIIFRSTEFGTLETSTPENPAHDGETGGTVEGTGTAGRWYHPHAHCIVWMSKGKLAPWKWDKLLSSVWEFWHHNWDEGKRIKDMREAVKYVVKPGDMVRLAKETPAELARLAAVLFRKKLCQPMAELALQKRAADRAGLMPALRWVNEGKRTVQKWTLIADANRNRIASGSQLSGLYGADGVKADFRAQGDDCRSPTPTALTNTAAARFFSLNHYGPKVDRDFTVCRVVARCVPAFNSRGLKEPRVIVCGSFFAKEIVLAHPLVRRMVSATQEAYFKGVGYQAADRNGLALLGERDSGPRPKARAIRVHTGTPTVFPSDPGPLGFDPDGHDSPDFWASLDAPASCNS